MLTRPVFISCFIIFIFYSFLLLSGKVSQSFFFFRSLICFLFLTVLFYPSITFFVLVIICFIPSIYLILFYSSLSLLHVSNILSYFLERIFIKLKLFILFQFYASASRGCCRLWSLFQRICAFNFLFL